MTQKQDSLQTLPAPNAPPLLPDVGERLEMGSLVAQQYRVDLWLGEGGFGQVWLVTDLATESLAALKLMREDVSEKALAAFEQEIWALATMEHSGIVRLIDEGHHLGQRFCVLEFVDGGELDLRHQPLKVALQVFDRILAALAYIHARGVVHRDLKPDNIHIAGTLDQYNPKLLDFGIAYIGEQLAARMRMSRVDFGGVTVQYSSPEQFSGEGVGPSTDLYSTGIMLYEVLAGSLPFQGPDVSGYFLQHVAHPPPPLNLPEALSQLEALVMDLLKKPYGERPECAADVRVRLAALMDALPDDLFLTPGGAVDADTTVPSAHNTTQSIKDTQKTEVTGGPGPSSQRWNLRRARSFPLEGREETCNQLWKKLEHIASAPNGHCAMLVGPTGIGRRRLARWLAERAQEEGLARVLRVDLGAWQDLESAMRRALLAFLRYPAQERGRLKHRIEDMLPALSADEALTETLLDFMLAQEKDAEPSSQHSLWSKVCARLATRASVRPLLLWFDGASETVDSEVVAWLDPLLRLARVARWPLMVVMSASPLDTSPSMTALSNHPQVSRMPLMPLTPEQSRRLIDHLEPRFSPDAAAFLVSQGQGLPAFVLDQIDHWHKNGNLQSTEKGLALRTSALSLAATSVEALLKTRVELLLLETDDPLRLSRALWSLALIGQAFSRNQAAWILEGLGVTPEVLVLRRIVQPRDDSPGSPLTFASSTLRRLLLGMAQGSVPLAALVPDCVELRLRASLEAMIVSDWDLARNELVAGSKLIEVYLPPNAAELDLLLLDGLARVAYRKRDLTALDGVVELLDERASLSEASLSERIRLAAKLWRACAAIARQEHQIAAEILDKLCLLDGTADAFFTTQAWAFRGMLALKDLAFARAGHLLKHACDALSVASAQSEGPYQRRLLRLTEGDALRDRGDYYGRKHRWNDQEEALKKALAIFREEGDVQGECRCLVLVTRMVRQRFEEAMRQGRTLKPELLDLAHNNLERLNRLMSTLDDRFGHGLGAWEAASLAKAEGFLEKAEVYYRTAREHFKSCHAQFEAALIDNALGELASQDDRHREALDHYTRFQAFMNREGHAHNEALALNSMGWMALRLGESDKAAEFFGRASTLLKSQGFDMAPGVDLAATRIGMAASAFHNGEDWHEVVTALQKALEFTKSMPIDEGRAQTALEGIRAGLGRLGPIAAKAVEHFLDQLQR